MSVALLLSLAAGAGADGSLTPSPPDVDVGTRSLARYEVVFEGAWNLQTTPGGLPSGAHFTPLIGGIHDDQVVFLRSGERASPGVEDMAELGLTGRLANEVTAGGAVVLERPGNIGPEGRVTLDTVELSTDSPRITLTTMIAPSPDWFVGVSGLSFLDPAGNWVASRQVNLYPWDAGTEDGTEFSLSNPATSPQGVIASLRGMGKFTTARMASLSFTPVTVLSLLETPTGHLTNLSTVPVPPPDGAAHAVWTFPAASDPMGRQGFVRVVNHSDVGGDVTIEAIDDVGSIYDALALRVGPGAVAAFNSEDLEGGEPEKGLDGSTGPGVGDWRLVLTSELDIEVLPYVRTSDGLVTSMHRVAPSASGRHRVAIFNPASNPNQLSHLRIINPGTEPAAVVIAGIDDDGSRSAASVEADIPPGEVREFRAAAPTRMGVVLVPSGLEDVFGDGQGKWRLDLDSPTPITVVNLLASPAGHLTNLSAARAP